MPRLRNRRAASFQERICRPRLPTFLLDHTMRRFMRPRERPRGTLFFPPQKCTRFTTQPNSQWLAFCSSVQTNLPQHEHKNCAAFFTVSRRSQRALPFCFQSRTSQNSPYPKPSDVTPIDHPPQGHSFLIVISGGGVFACFKRSA